MNNKMIIIIHSWWCWCYTSTCTLNVNQMSLCLQIEFLLVNKTFLFCKILSFLLEVVIFFYFEPLTLYKPIDSIQFKVVKMMMKIRMEKGLELEFLLTNFWWYISWSFIMADAPLNVMENNKKTEFNIWINEWMDKKMNFVFIICTLMLMQAKMNWIVNTFLILVFKEEQNFPNKKMSFW